MLANVRSRCEAKWSREMQWSAQIMYSVNLSPGFKNEFYPLQRGFRSFVNSAWISRGFRVDTKKC